MFVTGLFFTRIVNNLDHKVKPSVGKYDNALYVRKYRKIIVQERITSENFVFMLFTTLFQNPIQ